MSMKNSIDTIGNIMVVYEYLLSRYVLFTMFFNQEFSLIFDSFHYVFSYVKNKFTWSSMIILDVFIIYPVLNNVN
jgi:hypothetical protein